MPTSTISTSSTATTTAAAFNRFKTFTQELRLQGEAFGGRLDWLVGGYYANEKLAVDDNLSYGDDYAALRQLPGRSNFAASGHHRAEHLADALLRGRRAGSPDRAVSQYNAAVGGNRLPLRRWQARSRLGASRGSTIRPAGGYSAGQFRARAVQRSAASPTSPSRLAVPALTLNGQALDDSCTTRRSNNWALFTHNIFEITDRLKLTVGARYTHETKKLRADLSRQQHALHGHLGQRPALAAGAALRHPERPGRQLLPTRRQQDAKASCRARWCSA